MRSNHKTEYVIILLKPVNLGSGSSLRVAGVVVSVVRVLEAPFAGGLGPDGDEDEKDKEETQQHPTHNPANSAPLQSVPENKSSRNNLPKLSKD